ncbi:MAG: hypothetical protein JXA57_19445, partial [Armatimonadetes bacterium]|nr:hypothetical protein [Armatimonadota bacterium]
MMFTDTMFEEVMQIGSVRWESIRERLVLTHGPPRKARFGRNRDRGVRGPRQTGAADTGLDGAMVDHTSTPTSRNPP